MIKFSEVAEKDKQKAIELIKDSGLPVEDIYQENLVIYALKESGSIVATCALEIYGREALLRSFAVEDSKRGSGLGSQIYLETLKMASKREIECLYLLTTTAEGFFVKKGWSHADRNVVPESIKASKEFSSICPISAVCMMLNLK